MAAMKLYQFLRLKRAGNRLGGELGRGEETLNSMGIYKRETGAKAKLKEYLGIKNKVVA